MGATSTLLARAAPWAIATLLILVALGGSIATEAVDWGGEDFAAAAILLYGACAAWEVARRAVRSRLGRAVAAAIVLVVLLLVWAELAVGLLS